MKRRNFLKKGLQATSLLSLPYIVPSTVLGSTGVVSPNDKINLGFIGLGGKGFVGILGSLLQSFINEKSCKVVALCDVYKPNLERALNFVNETYNNNDCAAYDDFREIMYRKDIDAVVIATPDHWHAPMTVMAFENGKDVYCEKAVVNTIEEARRIVEVGKRYNRVFQAGSQSRSNPAFEYACNMLTEGRIGEIKEVDIYGYANPSISTYYNKEDIPETLDWEMWLGPAPYRYFNEKNWKNWRADKDFGGGGISDRGAHHFDVTQWGLGMDKSGPIEIIPAGVNGYKNLVFKYANGIQATVHELRGLPIEKQGVHFKGKDGTIHINGISAEVFFDPPELNQNPTLTQRKKVHWRKNIHGTNHYTNFLDCIRSRKKTNAHVEIGARSTSVCVLSNMAYHLNRVIKWDPVKMETVGDPIAKRAESKSMRAPWHI